MKKKTAYQRRCAAFLKRFGGEAPCGHHYSCVNGARCWSEGAKNNCPKIRTDESRTILSKGVQFDSEKKGGVIVFPADARAAELSPDKVRSWLQTASLTNQAAYGMAGWIIGYYLDGRYDAGNGAVFGNNSLSAAIAGIGFNSLLLIAKNICWDFGQKSVLVHDFTDGRIVIVDAD